MQSTGYRLRGWRNWG